MPSHSNTLPDKDTTDYYNYDKVMPYKLSNQFSNDEIKINIPANALYHDIFFKYEKFPPIPGTYSTVHQVHSNNIPLQKKYTISIKADSLPEKFRSKALIARVKDNDRLSSASGYYSNGYVTAKTSCFGRYVIAVDYTAPRIVPINIRNNADMTGSEYIEIKISDNFSGISTYYGKIDGKWVLFEYDAKKRRIYYYFDEHVEKGKTHKLFIFAADRKGNASNYKCSFKY